mmetsp:Transcript_17650/g.52746  ORF Transcript_17650/g.52746 Transcript_17650/m.52746 type:complete len:211 (-) Transcript_17650:496-1128(-)
MPTRAHTNPDATSGRHLALYPHGAGGIGPPGHLFHEPRFPRTPLLGPLCDPVIALRSSPPRSRRRRRCAASAGPPSARARALARRPPQGSAPLPRRRLRRPRACSPARTRRGTRRCAWRRGRGPPWARRRAGRPTTRRWSASSGQPHTCDASCPAPPRAPAARAVYRARSRACLLARRGGSCAVGAQRRAGRGWREAWPSRRARDPTRGR